ncbi:MAG: DUF418 domain-containing protein [Crocinitomicaceae bacterium]
MQTKRIEELDALRGFALFGILLVNVFVFHAPYSFYSEFYGTYTGLQGATVNSVVEFASGKFMFIFAFLFGYGISIQIIIHQKSFVGYFLKRMLVLLVFGILHIVLFWFGDILASYAILGVLVLPLRKVSNNLLLIVGTVFIFFRPLYYLGVVTLNWPMMALNKPAELSEFMSVFQQGNYLEIFDLRIKEFIHFIPENLVWHMSKTFGLFLIGMYCARKRMFLSIKKSTTTFTFVAVVLITISSIWIYNKIDFFSQFDIQLQPLWRPYLIAINIVFETAMGIGYIFIFTIIFQKMNTRFLAKTGRMALTNYILQSLICVFVFYGYGFGFYGKLEPTDLVWVAICIFVLNMMFSYFYLTFKSIGPLEYVWRKLIGKQN